MYRRGDEKTYNITRFAYEFVWRYDYRWKNFDTDQICKWIVDKKKSQFAIELPRVSQ